MAARKALAGDTSPSWTSSWNRDDAILYALAVGCGPDQLDFVAPSVGSRHQRVLPTFATTVPQRGRDPWLFDGLSQAGSVHADQSITLHDALPVDGHVSCESVITAVEQRKRGVLITERTVAQDINTKKPLITSTSGVYLKGQVVENASPPTKPDWEQPDRTPDIVATIPTLSTQALMYRLVADNNPLHYDQETAERAGFPRPLLHGLCTFGLVGAQLLEDCCSSEVKNFTTMKTKFSAPVYPGDELELQIWLVPDGARFRTLGPGGVEVLSEGTLITAGN